MNRCCSPSSSWNCVWGSEGQVTELHIPKSKIGFATIATGPFVSFANDLWTSIRLHAFPRHELHFFVFTDDEEAVSGTNVHTRFIKRLGWPFDSLGRPFIFGNASEWFQEMDYMFSIDADMLIVNEIDDSALGERVGALQAWFAVEKRSDFTYESRLTPAGTPYSSAFISPSEGLCYFAGGLFGGTLSGFQSITSSVVALALIDLEANPRHAALWEDESYINKVFLNEPPTIILGPAYVYPEPPYDEWLKTRLELFSANVVPRIYNLGVRKHGEVGGLDRHHVKERYAVLPAFMSPTSFAEHYPMLTETFSAVGDELTVVVRAFVWPHCLLKQISAVNVHLPFVQIAILYDAPNSFSSQWNLDQIREKAGEVDSRINVFEADHNSANRLKLRVGKPVHSDNVVHAPLKVLGDQLLLTVKTPYIVFIDDDISGVLPPGSQHLVSALEFGKFDIAGGCIENVSSAGYVNRQGYLFPSVYCDGPPPLEIPDYATPDIACWRVNYIGGFYAARTDVLRRTSWGKFLTDTGYDNFFVQASLGRVDVALCRGVSARAISCEGGNSVHTDINGNRFRHSSMGFVPIKPLIPIGINVWAVQSQVFIVFFFTTGFVLFLVAHVQKLSKWNKQKRKV
jgi:hypothetical protein